MMPECKACDGRREIGGFDSAENGYRTEPCEYCSGGKRTGLPSSACENCMNTGLKYPEAVAETSSNVPDDTSLVSGTTSESSSLNKPSSQEGLNAGDRRSQLRALLHGINAKIGMRDPNWWDVAAEIVNEEIEALARHPSFNDAIEAAAKPFLQTADAWRNWRDVYQATDHDLKSSYGKFSAFQIIALADALKLPDYRGGEKNDSTKTAEG